MADTRRLAALAELTLASGELRPDDIPAVVAGVFATAGAGDVALYLVDLEQRTLVHFAAPGEDRREALPVDGTVAGRTYRTETTVVADGPDGAKVVWLPLLDSAERLGVITATVDADPGETELLEWAALASLAGELVANKTAYGDAIVRTRRTRPLTIAAEMRWSMLPPLTYVGPRLAISAIVAPAYEIAGDTFDYAVNGDDAHVAIIDAVGHGLEAARIANLAVGTYRHSRRHDLGLAETYVAIDQAIGDQFGPEKFATAEIATLAMETGELRWVNAGHPPPIVVRSGHRVDLPSAVALPVGLGAALPGAAPPEVAIAFLEPGDLVLFFTDGIVEARSAAGEEFGRERLADLAVRAAAAAQPAAETVRVLAHAVLAHQAGVLRDDATLLLLGWRGPSGD